MIKTDSLLGGLSAFNAGSVGDKEKADPVTKRTLLPAFRSLHAQLELIFTYDLHSAELSGSEGFRRST